jgi:hypothetical protein
MDGLYLGQGKLRELLASSGIKKGTKWVGETRAKLGGTGVTRGEEK